MEAAGDVEQLSEIFELLLHILRSALAQHGAVACPIEQQGDLVGERQRRCAGNGANLLDELKTGFLGLRRKCGCLDRLQEGNAEESGVALEDLDRLGAETLVAVR